MASAETSSTSGFPAPQREAREPSEIGRRIADRYQIEQVLGEDAFTVTVVARHLALEERVRIQVLRPEHRFDSLRSAQYLRAIKALARIKTDHVVRVLDVGVALYLGPFLVLEELEGRTLTQLLSTEGRLPIPRAVDYVLQACKGLAVAHASGIVHGQLHPARLLLARRGEFETLKLIDFPTLEVPATERGPAYLAPEVLSSLGADRRADVWSLGAVLYELVTGRSALSPAPGSAPGDDPLAYDDPALTPALRAIIARCLQPEPERRFADVEALAAELMPLTTLDEVFRGSLTGSFSRQMMMAAAAQARAAASLAASARAQQSSWQRRASAWRASPRVQRWAQRWGALDRRWEAKKPPGAPALHHALAGAATLLLAIGAVTWGDLALRPPRPGNEQPAAPATVTVQAALQPDGAPPVAPDAPEPAQANLDEAARAVGGEPEPALAGSEAAEAAAAEAAPAGAAAAGPEQPDTAEPSGTPPGRAKAAPAKRRSGRDAAAAQRTSRDSTAASRRAARDGSTRARDGAAAPRAREATPRPRDGSSTPRRQRRQPSSRED